MCKLRAEFAGFESSPSISVSLPQAANGRSEWPLPRGQFDPPNFRSWPISDRLCALDRSFRSKLSNLTVTVLRVTANGQNRPEAVRGQRPLCSNKKCAIAPTGCQTE